MCSLDAGLRDVEVGDSGTESEEESESEPSDNDEPDDNSSASTESLDEEDKLLLALCVFRFVGVLPVVFFVSACLPCSTLPDFARTAPDTARHCRHGA